MKHSTLLIAIGLLITTFSLSAQITVSSDTICAGESITFLAPTSGFVAMSCDFENQSMGQGWSSTNANPTYNNPCGNGPSPYHIWIGATASTQRSIETTDFDFSTGQFKIMFWMRYGRVAGMGSCEDPDSQNEGVNLQYSIDHGVNWITLPGSTNPIGPNSTTGPYTYVTQVKGSGGNWLPESSGTAQAVSSLYYWHEYDCQLPAAAKTASTRLRWIQLSSSSSGFDTWGLDNIKVENLFTSHTSIWKDEANNTVSTQVDLINHIPSCSQWYYGTFTDTIKQLTMIDSIFIYVSPSLYVNLPSADSICQNDTRILDAGFGFDSYLWSTGDTTQMITINYPNYPLGLSIIAVEVENSLSCKASDTLRMTILNCASIKENDMSNSISVFPNPTTGILNLEIENTHSGSHSVDVIAVDGSVVYTKAIETKTQVIQEQLDLRFLQKGIYYIRISTQDNVYNGRFIKD